MSLIGGFQFEYGKKYFKSGKEMRNLDCGTWMYCGVLMGFGASIFQISPQTYAPTHSDSIVDLLKTFFHYHR